MERFRSLLSEPLVRFGIISVLVFIGLRIGLGLLKHALNYPDWSANLLAILAAGYVAYWLIYSHGH